MQRITASAELKTAVPFDVEALAIDLWREGKYAAKFTRRRANVVDKGVTRSAGRTDGHEAERASSRIIAAIGSRTVGRGNHKIAQHVPGLVNGGRRKQHGRVNRGQ